MTAPRGIFAAAWATIVLSAPVAAQHDAALTGAGLRAAIIRSDSAGVSDARAAQADAREAQAAAAEKAQKPADQAEAAKKKKTPDQAAPEEKAKKAGKKEKEAAASAPEDGLVWKDRPSLRFGKNFQMDLRVKLQEEAIQSPIDLAPFGHAKTFEGHRQRLGVKGEVLQHFEFEVERDFVNGGDWKNVYVNFKYLPFAQLQAGKFKIPFGYELLTSAVDLDFVYRTRASDSIAAGRDVGVMLHGRLHKKVIQYQLGWFKHDGDNSPSLAPPVLLPGEQAGEQKGAIAGRVTIEPLKLGSTPAHLNSLSIGGSVVVSTIPEGQNNLHGHMVLSDNFFHRDFYTKGRRLRIGAEAAWAPGPYSFSAEYIRSSEQRIGLGVGNDAGLNTDLPDLTGRGWYLAGTWALTGEKKEGGIKPKRPLFQGGFGAIELAARYESLGFGSDGPAGDPESKSPRAANVRRNTERAVTFGVNWYMNKWLKLQINGINESIDDPLRGPTPDSPKTSWMSVVTQLQFVL